MSFSVSEKRELWQKVGNKDYKIYEYENGIVTPSLTILFNDIGEKERKSFMKLLMDFFKFDKIKIKKETEK